MASNRDIKYEFVNRRVNLKTVYATFLDNFNQRGGRSSYPIVNQEFGSGKQKSNIKHLLL